MQVPPDEHDAAGDQRHDHRGPDADRRQRHLDRQPDLRLPVAALRHAAARTASAISGATTSTLHPGRRDVGKTIRVVVTATNAAGSTPATSAQTAVVQANVLRDDARADDDRRVGGGRRAAGSSPSPARTRSPAAGSTSKLTGLPAPAATSAQPIRALIYADNGSGAPGAFVAVSQQVTVAAGAAAGLGRLPVRELGLAAGGQVLARLLVRRLEHPGLLRQRRRLRPLRRAPPTRRAQPAGQLRRRQRLLARLLAVRDAWAAAPSAPANTVLPAISGTATQGQALSDDERHLDGQPDQLRLPVAALRQRGRQLRDISGATTTSYTLGRRRRRQDDPGGRDRDERERLDPGDLDQTAVVATTRRCR